MNIVYAGRQLDVDTKTIHAWMAQAERGVLKLISGCADSLYLAANIPAMF